MKCQNCGSEDVSKEFGALPIDGMESYTAGHLYSSSNPYLTLASIAVKWIFSDVYHCNNCKHLWRKWASF